MRCTYFNIDFKKYTRTRRPRTIGPASSRGPRNKNLGDFQSKVFKEASKPVIAQHQLKTTEPRIVEKLSRKNDNPKCVAALQSKFSCLKSQTHPQHDLYRGTKPESQSPSHVLCGGWG